MTSLYLDNRNAVLPHNISIKLVKENPYFTKSSSYTFDITLPLEGCPENLMIFKHINRHDVSKNQQTLKAKLIVDCKCLLDGTAVVKSISEKDVKVQLVSGNSEFNFFTKCDKIYIDEIEYGYGSIPNHEFDVTKAFNFYFTMQHTYFPVHNESADKVFNNLVCNYIIRNGAEVESFTYPGATYNSNCVHPNLKWIVSKLMQKLGYTFFNDLNSGIDFDRMYIANSTVTYVYNETLPHWTVNEFLDQLEKFLGVVFFVDEGKKYVEMISSEKFFEKYQAIYLDGVEDSYSVEFEDEKEDSLDLANIGYSLDMTGESKYLKLDEDTISNVKVEKFASFSELKAKYDKDDDYNRARKIYEADDCQYIEMDNNAGKELVEVNQFRNLYRNTESKELDIELKLVPSPMVKCAIDVYLAGSVYDKNYLFSFDIDIPSVPGHTAEDGKGIAPTVVSIIEGEAYEPFKPDKIYLYYWDGQMQNFTGANKAHKFPMPYIDSEIIKNKYGRDLPERSFRLAGPTGKKNLGNNVYNKVWKINQTNKEVKKFISKNIYSPNGVFIIKNKRYLCHKIQTTITVDGIEEEQEFTGYQLI